VTFSPDFPTTPGAFRRTHAGQLDAFATRLELMPVGVARYGRATDGCRGAPVIDVVASPRAGNSEFGVTCGRAPVNAPGAFAIGVAALLTPVRVFLAELWIDPAQPLFALPASSDRFGGTLFALPIPANAAGARFYAQFFWSDACAPGSASASNALAVTVQ
jgi:hypothetical protein